MRHLTCLLFLVLVFTPTPGAAEELVPSDSSDLITTTKELEEELRQIRQLYGRRLAVVSEKLREVDGQLRKVSAGKVTNKVAVRILTEKILLRDEREKLFRDLSIDLTRIRYKKGVEVIKILYEKVLGLDHHFSSLKTHHSIQRMANPNDYPEFKNSADDLRERLVKKSSVTLPNLLQSNGYVSAIYSLVSGFFGEGKPKERQAELDNVSCILDFTLKMSGDLNTIYFETEFLINNNDKLKAACLELFDEYTKVIGYNTPLDRCRNTDDWERIDELLETFIVEIKTAEASGDERLINSIATKGYIDLEFSVDRLLSYLDKYTAFVAEGENYYKKFAIVVDSYDNESICGGRLPLQFSALKDEINYSIEKFIQAYDIAELKGSKLKDLLYGYE